MQRLNKRFNCPHCGYWAYMHRAYKVRKHFRKGWAVTCSHCIRATQFHLTRRGAVKEWKLPDATM